MEGKLERREVGRERKDEKMGGAGLWCHKTSHQSQ